MNTLILLAALASWSYEGFSSEPDHVAQAVDVHETPAQPSVPSPPDPPATPAEPDSPTVAPVAPPPPAVATVSVPPPAFRPASAPPPPQVWRLADVNGQTWEHTDPEWLRRWVESRNDALRSAYRPYVPTFRPFYPAATTCTSGRCYRGR